MVFKAKHVAGTVFKVVYAICMFYIGQYTKP